MPGKRRVKAKLARGRKWAAEQPRFNQGEMARCGEVSVVADTEGQAWIINLSAGTIEKLLAK